MEDASRGKPPAHVVRRPVERRGPKAPGGGSGADAVALEAPLEIRVAGVPLAVLMRTPGDDLDLVRGFLTTERIVRDPGHVRSIRHCTMVADPEAEENVVLVTLSDAAPFDPAALRRNLYATSSCGVCGKASIERAMAAAPPLADGRTVSIDVLFSAFDALAARQPTFAASGGTHAAALLAPHLPGPIVAEDVGRHNAVDKVVGRFLAAGRATAHPEPPLALLVSGRISFEVVQKALAARIPLVAGISAPTSLAVDLAESAGLTLAGFVRDGRATIYAHPWRLDRPASPHRPPPSP